MSRVPSSPQNTVVAGYFRLHTGQTLSVCADPWVEREGGSGTSAVPSLEQKREPSDERVPQWGQTITLAGALVGTAAEGSRLPSLGQ